MPAVIRTQISLTGEHMARLRAEAKRRGVSMAAIVREAVDRHLRPDLPPDGSPEPADRGARFARALGAVGRFDSGTGDLAARRDELAGDGRW